MRLDRVGVVIGTGYVKCGSRAEVDWVKHLRLFVSDGQDWELVLDERDIPRPADDETIWLGLGGIEPKMVLLELRRAGIDGWWPTWPLAMSGLILEGTATGRAAARTVLPVPALVTTHFDIGSVPAGVQVETFGGEVRYTTPHFEIGFRLKSPSLSYLSIDDEGLGRTHRNVLQQTRHHDSFRLHRAAVPVLREPMSDYMAQGIRLTTLSGTRPAGFLSYGAEGTVSVRGNIVSYDVTLPEVGQTYKLTWTVLTDRVVLEAERKGEADVRAWHSSAFQISVDTRLSQACVLGTVTRSGETGIVDGPFVWHTPTFGSLRVDCTGDALWRGDVVRQLEANTLELKLGEVPQPEGDYLLRHGTHRATAELIVESPEIFRIDASAPPQVKRMFRRRALTAFPFRVDTAMLSNNGTSVHWYGSLDEWAALAMRAKGEIVDGLCPGKLFLDSLERWLAGAPGHGSGRTSHGGYNVEDEYLQVGVAPLRGVGEYLSLHPDPVWLASHHDRIRTKLDELRERDLDGDGLIESDRRDGISGSHHWSTNFYDLIAFGWKDALSNALLYSALQKLVTALPANGAPELAAGLPEWAELVRANYAPTFFNPESGLIAGWRSKDGALHDYAFPAPNGAAVSLGLLDEKLSREVMERLWRLLNDLDLCDFRLGVPTNLHEIDDADIGGFVFGLPRGSYIHGGITHSQSQHLVNALYRVGMIEEGDAVLTALCTGMADGTVIGGNGTGVDWRLWDGAPSGYEGLLANQFAFFATAVDRFGTDSDQKLRQRVP
jgi:hypothetical protein